MNLASQSIRDNRDARFAIQMAMLRLLNKFATRAGEIVEIVISLPVRVRQFPLRAHICL